MPAIGYVTKQKDGTFKGQLKTLLLPAPPSTSCQTPQEAADNQPDYRVYSQARSRSAQLG